MKVTALFSISTIASVASARLAPTLHSRQSQWTVGQDVETSSGRVSGHAAKNDSSVSEYLGIPFAKAPIGDLRFAAPVKFEGNSSLSGNKYGPSCPLKTSTGPAYTPANFKAANVTAEALTVLSILSTSGANYSEDCLYLNVWTKPQSGESKKAVLVWLYGGGFTSGSSSIPAYNGANLVEEQDVILVSLNYRLNILGFPGNPDSAQNLAILDQRMAMEWIRDNIEKFGGDPERITLFGQSAGAASVDIYNFAYADDPIAAGFIPESGIAYGWGLPNSQNRSAGFWYNVTESLGCGNAESNSDEVLSCMRKQNHTDILNAVPDLSATAGILGGFGPTVDGTVVFANYTERKPSKSPMLIGNTNYEAGLFRLQFGLQGLIYSNAFWDAFNLLAFTCPGGIRANMSKADGVPTWRYRYFGEFPNLRISTDSGAWHTSEVPMIFNTAPGEATTAQISIGKYMRGAWAAFAKKPATGLTEYGWPEWDPAHDTLVRLAYNNITGPNLINPYRYDADCIFFNISDLSRGDDPNSVPTLPDLGASVTPTGSRNGSMPSPTASSSPSGTGAPAEQSHNSASKIGSCLWVGFLGVFASLLL